MDLRVLPKAESSAWEWQLHSSCRGADQELFFPAEGERAAQARLREQRAKRVCEACPVLSQCRSFALSTRQEYGIWGGMTEDERRSMHRATTRSA